MNLQTLRISREQYGKNKGALSGVVMFSGKHGNVELPLDEEMAQQILHFCADAIARAGRDIANNLTAEIIENAGLPAIESPLPPGMGEVGGTDLEDEIPF